MSECELLHAWKQGDKSLRLYREYEGSLVLRVFQGEAESECSVFHEIAMSPATATSVGRMLVRKTVGK